MKSKYLSIKMASWRWNAISVKTVLCSTQTHFNTKAMDIKNLQYLMGHSDAGVTLNVYTHASYAHAAEQMAEISQFRHSPEAKKTGLLLLDKQQIRW